MNKMERLRVNWKKNWQLHLMLFPGILLILLFKYVPLSGILIAFKDFIPRKGIFGSPWVGMENFEYMFSLPDTMRVLWNTLKIAVLKIVINFPIPIIIAILLNEVKSRKFKKSVQTIIYLPYFISWVILSGMILDIFSLDGVVNQILGNFGVNPIFFMGDKKPFLGLLIGTDVWKNFGYGTVVYLAAITGVDESLYESAKIDGASRWKQILYITLPSIAPIVMLMMILNLGNILNAGFEQILIMYNPTVERTVDILDTLVYRLGMTSHQYSAAAAMGLFKSVISLIFVGTSYLILYKKSDYRVF